MFRSFLLVLLLCSCSIAVYEDEVGIYDWAQFNIGCVIGAEFSSSDPHIFVTTDQGAIACLDESTGNLNWRQMLPDGAISEKLILFNNDKHLLVLSNNGTRVYLWRTSDGGLMWEQEIQADLETILISTEFSNNAPQVCIVGHDVAILSNNSLFLISLRSGNILWNAVRSPEGKVSGLVTKGESAYVVVQEKQFLVSYHWDTETGAFRLLKDIEFPSNGQFVAAVAVHQAVVFASPKKICLFDVSENEEKFACRAVGEMNIAVAEASGDSPVHLAVVQSKEDKAILVSWVKGGQNNLYQYSRTQQFSKVEEFSDHDNTKEFFVSNASEGSFFARNSLGSDDTILELFFADSGRRKYLQLPIASEKQGLVKGLFWDDSHPSRFLVVCEDNSVSLIDEKTSKVFWTREESLASIHIAKFMEIPSPIVDVEQIRHSQGILQQFYRRIMGQIEAFEQFLVSEFQSPNTIDPLSKDRFGFNKLLMLASRTGKLFCVSNLVDHPIIWDVWFPGEDIEDLILTHLGSAVDSRFLVLTKNRETNLSTIYVLNPFDGSILQQEKLSYSISHTLLFPQKHTDNQRILLIIDEKQKAHVFPNTAETQSIVALLSSSTYDFRIDSETGIISGYQLEENIQQGFMLTLEEHWRVSLSENEKIIHLETLSDTQIHSAIRLLPNNTAMPKYINRNLIAVATLTSTDDGEMESVNIYLIDSVTGAIIHHTFHPQTCPPLHMVLCENFLVYTYWNKRTYRTEVSVIELYEKQVDWTSTSFSSFSGLQPNVFQQSFEVNFFVTSLAITQTRRGITTHNLLFGTQSGQLVALDKRWIDPLRPIEEKIPGMIPYAPELLLFSKAFLSHTVQVENLSHIISTSAHLESTSLVFVWGLDHFYTHVRPAEKFDMLHSDFDFISLFGTVGILLLLTIISYSLHKKNKLMSLWK